MKVKIVLLLSLAIVFGKPTTKEDAASQKKEGEQQSIREIVEDVAADLTHVVKSKAGVVSFVGNTAANAAIEVSSSAMTAMTEVDVEAALNQTEDALKAHKVAMIEGFFDAKRQALRTLATASAEYSASLAMFLNQTINQINAALAATHAGITVSKTMAADMAAQITIENAQEAVNTAVDSVEEAVNTAVDSVEASGSALINALLKTKEQLYDTASNFNSQEAVHNGTTNLGKVVNSTFYGAEMYAEQLGIFKALDNFVHSIAMVPAKINSLLLPEAAAPGTGSGDDDDDEEADAGAEGEPVTFEEAVPRQARNLDMTKQKSMKNLKGQNQKKPKDQQ